MSFKCIFVLYLATDLSEVKKSIGKTNSPYNINSFFIQYYNVSLDTEIIHKSMNEIKFRNYT
jgi:hypothetical protein